MKIMFMGTPDFAVPCLERLIADGYDVAAVVTRADKPKGRGYEMTPSPVKVCAVSHGVPVYTPETLKDKAFEDLLSDIAPDMIVVTAYGKILPEYVINYPKYGCINIHASLLPKLRGAAPIQWSIVNGYEKTGITSMQMDTGLDTGDMILCSEIKIEDDFNCGILHDKLAQLGACNLSQTIKLIIEGKAVRTKQDDSASCYAPRLTKENTFLPKDITVKEAYNFIRGLSPFPTAHTVISGKRCKIYSCRPVYTKPSASCGEAFEVDGEIAIAFKDGYIIVEDMVLEGQKRMTSKQYLLGHSL